MVAAEHAVKSGRRISPDASAYCQARKRAPLYVGTDKFDVLCPLLLEWIARDTLPHRASRRQTQT